MGHAPRRGSPPAGWKMAGVCGRAVGSGGDESGERIMATASYGDLHLYRRLLRESRPYWPHILGIFLLELLGTPLGLLSPLPLKIAVDSAIGNHPLPRFLSVVLPVAVTQSPMAVLALAVGLLLALAVVNQ